MSKTTIESNRTFNEEQNELLQEFKKFIDALISKDKAIMEAFLAPSFILVHMSGQNQPKEGFIKEVIDGTLNYFKAKIIDPEIEIKNNIANMKVDIAFDALVYGAKGSWTLHAKNKFEKINNKWYFVNWNTKN